MRSANFIALSATAGVVGPQGPQGIQGVEGPQGPIGNTGPQGLPGNNGADGSQGIQGIQGLKGDTGTAGTNGTNGVGVPVGGTAGQVLSKIDGTNYNTQWVTASGGSSDHGALTGLADDDHTQYHTDARGDARYSLLAHNHSALYEPLITKSTGYAKWNGTAWTFANETYQASSANLTAWSALATSAKQDTLVSGTNIKTINGASVLGSGDLVVTGGAGLSAQTAVMSATQASTVVTMADVTALALPMVANGVYQVNCFVTFQSAATTTGLGLGYTSPSGCRVMAEVVVPLTSTAAATQLRTTFPNAAVAVNTGSVLGTGVTAINSNHTARISGIVRNGATAGNFQVQFRSEIAASAVTLQIGSELQLIRIA